MIHLQLKILTKSQQKSEQKSEQNGRISFKILKSRSMKKKLNLIIAFYYI